MGMANQREVPVKGAVIVRSPAEYRALMAQAGERANEILGKRKKTQQKFWTWSNVRELWDSVFDKGQ